MSPQFETPHQRSINLIASAMRYVVDGDTGLLDRAGLSEQHVPHLQQMNIAQLVDLATEGVDLPAYLQTITDRVDDPAVSAALIQHAAPRQLMMQLFAMTTRRYAAERLRLNVTSIRGRPAVNGVSRPIEHRLWHLWVLFANPRDPARLRRPDHWLLIALEAPGQLRTAWSLIQRWAREDVACKVLAQDRARLTSTQLLHAEQSLRDKHWLRGRPVPSEAQHQLACRAEIQLAIGAQ